MSKKANGRLYGPGELGDHRMYRSGTRLQSNQTPERRAIYTVASPFLGRSVGINSRKMEQDYFSVHAEVLNVVKLIHWKKLDKEIYGDLNSEDNCLFNTVGNGFAMFHGECITVNEDVGAVAENEDDDQFATSEAVEEDVKV